LAISDGEVGGQQLEHLLAEFEPIDPPPSEALDLVVAPERRPRAQAGKVESPPTSWRTHRPSGHRAEPAHGRDGLLPAGRGKSEGVADTANTAASDTPTSGSDQLVKDLNDDLQLEFQSIVQYVNHVATITGAEFTSTVDELKVHLSQELRHATVLAEQVAFLDAVPASQVPAIAVSSDSRSALQADLDLETRQLERYRERVEQATALGLPDVAEALRPLLTETQEHVRDLQAALGR
jgi:bacterioferritin